MNSLYQFVEGTPGVGENDVAHLLIPGRFRGDNGIGISELTQHRVDAAAAFYLEHGLDGVIVCSGYKNPADKKGNLWRDSTGSEYQGQPEAYGMRFRLEQNYPIYFKQIVAEPNSIDTTTNLTRSQGLFPDQGPVGIVAQADHLGRILDIIAPRTMRQPYAGILVPEASGQPDKDPRGVRLVSRWVTHGLQPDTPNSTAIAEKRILRIYNILLAPSVIREHLSQALHHQAQERA